MPGKTDSREKIISAASCLFQMKGYHATGLNEIIRLSGAPKGSLYYYFPGGKEELALAAVESAGKIIQRRVRGGLCFSEDPVSAIQKVIRDIAEAIETDGKLQNVSVSLIALETCLSSVPLREACKRTFIQLEEMYAEKLRKSGYPDDAAAELGEVIQAMVEGAVTISVTQKDAAPLLAVARQIPVLLHGKN